MSSDSRVSWLEIILVGAGLLLLLASPISIIHWLSCKEDANQAGLYRLQSCGTKIECETDWAYTVYGKLVNFRRDKLTFLPEKATRPIVWIFERLKTPQGRMKTLQIQSISNHCPNLSAKDLKDFQLFWKDVVGNSGVHMVNFNGCNVDDQALQGVDQLPGLAVLDVSGSRVGDRFVERLAAAPALEALALGRTEVTGRGLEQVAGGRLKRLDLSGCKSLAAENIVSLAEVQAQLGEVVLDLTPCDDAVCAALAKIPALARLSLVECPVGDGGVKALASCGSLIYLDLSGSKVGDAGVLAVAKSSRLSHLKLQGIKLSEATLLALAGNPSLRWLDLRKCGLTPEVVSRVRQGNSALTVFVDSP